MKKEKAAIRFCNWIEKVICTPVFLEMRLFIRKRKRSERNNCLSCIVVHKKKPEHSGGCPFLPLCTFFLQRKPELNPSQVSVALPSLLAYCLSGVLNMCSPCNYRPCLALTIPETAQGKRGIRFWKSVWRPASCFRLYLRRHPLHILPATSPQEPALQKL